MLRFFRSSNTVTIVIILLIGLVVWLYKPDTIETAVPETYGMFLFTALTECVVNTPLVANVAGLFMFLAAAIMLVIVNVRLNLIDKISFMPTLCYFLLIGGMPEIHLFSPEVIATVIIIAVFIILMKTLDKETLSYNFFKVSALISFGTFFYQYMYVYMFVVWFIIAFWRPGYWREWVLSILGFVLPIFFAFCWFYLVDDAPARITSIFEQMLSIQRNAIHLSTSAIVFLSIIGLLTVLTFLYSAFYISSKKTVVRTGYYVLILIAIATIGMISVIPDAFPMAWYLLSFPLSFVISCYLASVKSIRWGTVVFAVFLACVVVVQIL